MQLKKSRALKLLSKWCWKGWPSHLHSRIRNLIHSGQWPISVDSLNGVMNLVKAATNVLQKQYSLPRAQQIYWIITSFIHTSFIEFYLDYELFWLLHAVSMMKGLYSYLWLTTGSCIWFTVPAVSLIHPLKGIYLSNH